MDSQTLVLPDIDFVYNRSINFALQQNHVPVVREIILRNQTEADWSNLIFEISCEPDFAMSWKQDVALIKAGESYQFKSIVLSISSKFLSELTERINGSLTLTIFIDGLEKFKEIYPIDVLAYDQWPGIGLLPEMVCAFITPNHPEIPRIIHRASNLLERWTGNPSFDEYQSRNPDRVRKQMAAVYEAIAEMQIVYCTVPPSFEETGQRVRLPEAIVANKLANCLDLSLLFAACLEAIGIHPLIVIIKGHAFTGGWLIDESFADPVNDDPSLLTKRTANGINEITLVEATCMNVGRLHSFDHAVSSADQKMLNTDEFLMFIDVKRSRFGSIRPLPLRIATSLGWEIKEEIRPERQSELPEEIYIGEKLVATEKIDVSKQRMWERKLLDLTLRNSLLNVRMTKSVIQFITVNSAKLEDSLANGDEFQVLSKPTDWDNPLRDTGVYQAIHQSDPIAELVKHELSHKRIRTYLTDAELVNSLTNVYRSSRLSMEENGANTLFIGIGMLKWYETNSSERPRYAPILLLPVEIIRKSAQKGYVIRSRQEETIMNITLLEMIRQDFGITIGGLEALPMDESGVDVKSVFNIMRQAIMSKARWDVEEQAILGTFSFSKFILWNDIHNNADKLCRNKVVASLVSGKLEWEPEDNATLSDISDAILHPSNVALPISTDSSQLQAIITSAQGKSFVLHGPPGTGKSQTITNIIANALFAGKKVLFVAAKKAALDVVENRLESIGIGSFCLELHSNKSKKADVLEQLKAATAVINKKSPENFKTEADRLFELRNDINIYVVALHRKYPFGYSLFELITNHSQIQTQIETVYFENSAIEILSKEKLLLWEDIAEELQAVGKVIGHPKGHPLSAIKPSTYTPQLKQDVRIKLENFKGLLERLISSTVNISTIIKLKDRISSYEHEDAISEIIENLIPLGDFPASMLETESIENTMSQLIGVASHGVKRNLLRSSLLEKFHKDILIFPGSQTLIDWDICEDKWFLSRWIGQNKITKIIKRFSLNRKLEKEDVPLLLQKIIDYQREQEIIEKAVSLPKLLGFLWKEGDPDWENISKIALSISNINRIVGNIIGSQMLKLWRMELASEFTEGSEIYFSAFQNQLKTHLILREHIKLAEIDLQKLLSIEFQPLKKNAHNWSIDQLSEVNLWLEHLEELKDWYNWLVIRSKAINEGLDSVINAVDIGTLVPDEILNQFKKGFYRSAAEYIIEKTPSLATFNGGLFSEKVAKFKAINENFQQLTREELYTRLASKIPSFTQEASQSSEIGMLQRAIANKGRALSIRKIFDSIPNLLTRLTPCMLMSPISVAQYFDADSVKFDLVIFDEASQMPTCEAVGAIARATNVIVVGDPKQMPPTSFFATNNIDEENIEKEDLESILDDCLALSMPSQHLLWHYRSKHESLIAFSNAKYYENKLLTFPSTDDIISKVQYVKVNGYYDKGKTRQNKFEAKAIVDEVIMRLSDPKLAKRSIGIVTFSSVQQSLIEDLLTDVFSLRPDLEQIALETEEPIFIKNLENVQGDERDVIMFSIGYGPDENGNVSHNFGPINREGGWRRLNVAVSRARYEMRVFSTLRSDQIDLNRAGSEGVAGLKAFLAYAEKGKVALPIRNRVVADRDGSFESLIAMEIRKNGFEVHTMVGCSEYKIDIAIVDRQNPSEYILGIMTDGKTYSGSNTSKDREITQIDVLRMLGWNTYRIWSTEWWEKPEKVISGILRAISTAEENKGKNILELSLTDDKHEYDATQLNFNDEVPILGIVKEDLGKVKDKEFYQLCELDPVITFYSDEFFLYEKQNVIKAQIMKVLEVEAPISRNLLCKRVLNAWGISRLGARINVHFESLFVQLGLQTTISGGNEFFWKEGQLPTEYNCFRVPKNELQKRDAEDLPPDEVAIGIKMLLINQISMPKQDLVREGAKLFGYTRVGPNVELKMLSGIQKAIDRGFAKKEGERIVISES